MPPRRSTPSVQAIAERTVSVLDYLNRIIGALKDGNGDYLRSKMYDMKHAVDSLADAADTGKRFDGSAVTAIIERDARHYHTGRMLFPIGGDPFAAHRQATLRQAATSIRFDPPEGIDPHTAGIVAEWLTARAENPE